jgi:hypothetical protein
MLAYRCFFIADCRIADVEIIDCPDDDAAVRRALELLRARNGTQSRYSGVEVWLLARLVYVYPAGAPGTPHQAATVSA